MVLLRIQFSCLPIHEHFERRISLVRNSHVTAVQSPLVQVRHLMKTKQTKQGLKTSKIQENTAYQNEKGKRKRSRS